MIWALLRFTSFTGAKLAIAPSIHHSKPSSTAVTVADTDTGKCVCTNHAVWQGYAAADAAAAAMTTSLIAQCRV